MTTSLSETKTLPSTTSSITSTQTTITSSITISDLATSPQIGGIPLQIPAKLMPYDPMKSRCWSIGSIVDSKNLAQRTNSGSITIDNKELVTQHEEITSAISDEFNFLPYVHEPAPLSSNCRCHYIVRSLIFIISSSHPHATPLRPRRRQAPPLQVRL